MNSAHVAEEDSNLEEGVFGVQNNSGNEESILGLVSVEPLDDEENDGDGGDWFSVTDEDVFDDVWDLEES